jgi:hypothetical protein
LNLAISLLHEYQYVNAQRFALVFANLTSASDDISSLFCHQLALYAADNGAFIIS